MKNKQSGVIMILFSILIVPLIFFIGMAIDFATLARIKFSAQKAANAATLSALIKRANDGYSTFYANKTAVSATMSSVFIQNMAGSHITVVACGGPGGIACFRSGNNFTVSPGDNANAETASGNLTLEYRSTFLKVIPGFNNLVVNVSSKATMRRANVILMLDVSGSMNWGAKTPDLSTAVGNFLSRFNPTRDRIAVVTFNNTAKVNVPMNATGGFVWDQANKSIGGFNINNINPSGQTNIADAFRQGYKHLRDTWPNISANELIDLSWVLFTDGSPTAGTFFFENGLAPLANVCGPGVTDDGTNGCLSIRVINRAPDGSDFASSSRLINNSKYATIPGITQDDFPPASALLNCGRYIQERVAADFVAPEATLYGAAGASPACLPVTAGVGADLAFCVPDCQRNFRLQYSDSLLNSAVSSFYGGNRNLGLKTYSLLTIAWADFVRMLPLNRLEFNVNATQNLRSSRIYAIGYGRSKNDGYSMTNAGYPQCQDLEVNRDPVNNDFTHNQPLCSSVCINNAGVVSCRNNASGDYYYPYQDSYDEYSQKPYFLSRLVGQGLGIASEISEKTCAQCAPAAGGFCTKKAEASCVQSRRNIDFPTAAIINGQANLDNWGDDLRDTNNSNGRYFIVNTPQDSINAFSTIARKVMMTLATD
ncbi:MAG: VWA domain-containing protein [Deltaproteobacteria bacterium]|nr:VWA domain-containing protein [Deltaproteobacteria bacterium]